MGIKVQSVTIRTKKDQRKHGAWRTLDWWCIRWEGIGETAIISTQWSTLSHTLKTFYVKSTWLNSIITARTRKEYTHLIFYWGRIGHWSQQKTNTHTAIGRNPMTSGLFNLWKYEVRSKTPLIMQDVFEVAKSFLMWYAWQQQDQRLRPCTNYTCGKPMCNHTKD